MNWRRYIIYLVIAQVLSIAWLSLAIFILNVPVFDRGWVCGAIAGLVIPFGIRASASPVQSRSNVTDPGTT